MIVTEARPTVSVLRMERRERRNALVPEMVGELVEALKTAAERRRPVVLIGSDSAFSPRP